MRDASRRRHALQRIGIDRGTVRIVGKFEAAAVDIGQTVVGASEIEPGRQCGRGEICG